MSSALGFCAVAEGGTLTSALSSALPMRMRVDHVLREGANLDAGRLLARQLADFDLSQAGFRGFLHELHIRGFGAGARLSPSGVVAVGEGGTWPAGCLRQAQDRGGCCYG